MSAANLPDLVTARLRLRRLVVEDAAFILELVNDPDWIRFIGDRGIRSIGAARAYLAQGPLASYRDRGYGLYGVEERAGGRLTGVCGLVKRPAIDDVEIGFAFLPAFRGRGYAFESAQAVIAHDVPRLRLPRLVAIVSPENARSIALLERLGLRYERNLRLPGETADVRLYGR